MHVLCNTFSWTNNLSHLLHNTYLEFLCSILTTLTEFINQNPGCKNVSNWKDRKKVTWAKWHISGINCREYVETNRVWAWLLSTGRFIMFSMITNIYNKKTKWPTLMELFTATGKLKFFWQLQMFHVCTTGDMAHIDMIFKFLPHTHQHVDTWGKNLNIVLMCAVSPVVHASNISSCQKKLFQFSCGCEQFH
jgi:hypothetical protein